VRGTPAPSGGVAPKAPRLSGLRPRVYKDIRKEDSLEHAALTGRPEGSRGTPPNPSESDFFILLYK
jgi:hypothetical protein